MSRLLQNLVVFSILAAAGCSSDSEGNNSGSGGTDGGSGSGGSATGGSATGGSATGGSSGAGTGGTSSGGAGAGGSAGSAAGGATGGTGGGVGGTGGSTTCPVLPPLKLTPVSSGLSNTVFLTSPPGDTARLFLVRKTGTIRIIKNGTTIATPFLNVSSLVEAGDSERGLLGLAFHPQYATNGRFFVYYTQSASPNGDIVIAEYKVSANNPDVADPVQVQELDQIPHSTYANHNGGMLAFGPDGYLYAGVGDGGLGGDPFGSGQSLTTELGKILRINVDNPSSSPPGNQVGKIWDWGLRNPWRFSFDRQSGDLWIADVGQGNWEEVDFEPAGTGKRNYGWSLMEGAHCYPSGSSCDQSGKTLPLVEYSHSSGCSITGGYVYRGSAIPCLQGWYFYGDYCAGSISAVYQVGGVAQGSTTLPFTVSNLSSFGEDANGELYAIGLNGNVQRIEAQ